MTAVVSETSEISDINKISGIKEIQKKYCSRAMVLSLAAAGVLILFDLKPVAKGLVLGTIFSIINFVLMGLILPARLNKVPRKTFWVSLGGIWVRYLVLALPLIIAYYHGSFNFFATAVGLFMIQIIILIHHLGGLIFRFTP